MKLFRAKLRRVLADRRFTSARLWSNDELRKLAPLLDGDVVNVSGWDDRDKEGGRYRDYFSKASSYSITNYSGDRGLQGAENEHFLDLTDAVPAHLLGKFDVAFNHTTMEHIFDVRRAFANLCALSRDVVVTVVPFAQLQHEGLNWKDYWRFTPTCMKELFAENGLDVVYEVASGQRNAAIYLLTVAVRDRARWETRLPPHQSLHGLGGWLGRSRWRSALGRARVLLRRQKSGDTY